jgi:galactonate dehydratase
MKPMDCRVRPGNDEGEHGTMKIATVECLPVHSGWRKNFVFVRLSTDAGVVGWGEAYSQYDRDRAVAAQVEELGRYLIGRDPFHIRHILQIAFDDYAQRRGSLELYCATSGIEQALWDIAGKITGQPVYNLLGGPCRSRVRVYANGWSYKMQQPQDYARAAEAVLGRGFTALKFDPLPGPWRTYIPKEHIRRAVKVTRAVRDAVGPDVDILIGCTGAWPRCTPSISPMRWRNSSRTGSRSRASRRTSKRWRKSAAPAPFRS